MVNDQVSHSNIPNTAIDPKSVLVENSANTMNGTTSQHSTDPHGYSQVSNSPPMAVLPLNPSAKLDQEPNPFEQSFSSASKTSPSSHKSKLPSTSTTNSAIAAGSIATPTSNGSTTTITATSNEPLKLPPVAAMTSPAASGVMSSVPKDIANQYAWDSLRAGPLSPSMLQRPTNPDDYAYSNINPSSSLLSYQDVAPNSYQGKNDSFYQQGRSQTTPNNKYQQDKQSPVQKSTKKSTTKKQTIKSNGTTPSPSATSPTPASQRRKLDLDEGDDDYSNDDKSVKKPRTDEEDEKRKNFLERNRLAALKCRQRKKQWLNNLQAKVEYLTNDNEQLQIQTNALREEIMNLKTLLLAHKDCPISQGNAFTSNINPKAIGAQQQQTLLRGTGVTTSSMSATAATTTAPMFTAQPYNHPSSHHHHRPSTTAAQSAPALNMVMVSQHSAPQPSAVSSSSGVMQF